MLTDAQKTQLTNARAGRAFAVEGIEKLDVFFGGLPGAVTSTRTVTADAVAYGTAPTINLGIANPYGRIPSGTATLNINGQVIPQVVAQNAAQYNLPVLAPGNYPFTITYPTDAQLLGFTETGTLEVTKAAVASTVGAVLIKPTTQKTGSYKVTVTPPSGLAAATGTVTVTLKSGATTKTVSGPLAAGAATLTLPALSAGTWTSSIAYTGDSHYSTATAAGPSIAVAKVGVASVAAAVISSPTTQKTGSYKVTVTPPSGLAAASGIVTVTLKSGTTTKTVSGALAAGAATLTLPALPAGTWTSAITYAGDSNYSTVTVAGPSITTAKVRVASVTTAIIKTPTTTVSGAYRVTVTPPAGLANPTGTVTITLTKGSRIRTASGTLAAGTVSVSLPALPTGTWSVVVKYSGDGNYLGGTVTGKSVAITR